MADLLLLVGLSQQVLAGSKKLYRCTIVDRVYLALRQGASAERMAAAISSLS